MPESPELTDFGFQRVAADEKTARVRAVFRSVAGRYDRMNDLMSGGLHRAWKDALATWLRPRAGQRLMDLAGGTGDVAFRICRASGGPVLVTDINADMLQVGMDRAARRGLGDHISWLCADAERLPLPDGALDAVSCAFGVRNMTRIERALAEVRRVLKPGGRFVCLEFSRLVLPGLQGVYDSYSFNVVPRLGRWVAGDEDSYRYLVESIRRFPDQDAFTGMLQDAGLGRVAVQNLAGGIAAMHSAWRI